MADPDYLLALLLQQQIEHENRHNVDHDAQVALKLQAEFDQERNTVHQTNQTKDVSLAFQLQEQFNDEIATEKFNNGLVYNAKGNANTSKSLVDPSWELVDPTPNIYTLFVAFNERYFWNKLFTVTVSWSKRMTTCAGICSYAGRGSICKITLSEPLLKLRPRKDLVETLLHEMIHAYLFVTDNNKDRDGHGAEFHKHMWRINAEAGTNITVYHDFHDEVRLYKQHWWKCNGPCQHRKPYYGMVRRATNRAPGPNDFWWGEHSRSCGGTFVKVKEPEKPEKKKKAEKENKPVKSPNNSIKNYFPVSPTNKKNPSQNPEKASNVFNVNKNNTSQNLVKPSNGQNVFNEKRKNPSQNPVKPSTVQNVFNDNSKVKNIHGFHDIDKLATKSSNASSSSNIKGFHNIGNTNYSSKGGTSTRYNGTTVVINKKPTTSTKASPIVPKISSSVSSPPQRTDYAVVRNHWINKFSDTSNPPKRARIETEDEVLHDNVILINCPVCEKSVPDGQLDEHLNKCMDQHTHCDICNKNVPNGSFEKHKSECSSKDCVECDICGELIKRTDLEQHKINCLHEISMSLNESNDFKECPLCNSSVDPDIFDRHLEACVLGQMNDMQESLDTISCLVCNKTVPKSNLNAHLNECMTDGVFLDKSEADAFVADNSLMEVYDSSRNQEASILISDGDDERTNDESNGFVLSDAQAKEYERQGKKVYNCPVCDKKILMDKINDHLDMCAGI